MINLFWFLTQLIKLFIYSIKWLIGFIITTLQYSITVSVLSVTLVTRTRIGQRAFVPWNNKIFGSGDRGEKTEWYARLWTIFLLYVWVRIFFIVYVFSKMSLDEFDFHEWRTLKFLGEFLAVLFYSYEFLGESIFNLSYDYAIGYLYSYYVVLLGLAHLLSFELLHFTKRSSTPTHLGDSLIFGWLKKYTGINDVIIWCWLEPLLTVGIGFLLLINGYMTYACFFWIAGLSMVLTGNDKRMKMRGKLGGIDEGEEEGEIIEKREKEKDRTKENKPPKNGGGAQW